jgi:AcrR family transcriptional regulator
MDPKETREQIIRDAKSGIILDAARKVFAEKGFHDTHLEEIAAAAGFSKAALYNYYSDKETIFLSLANRDFDHLSEALKNGIDPNAKFIDTFEKTARIFLSFFGDHFAFFLATSTYRSAEKTKTAADLTKCPHAKFSQFMQKFENFIDIFIGIIGEAKKKGEIDCPIEDKMIARYIVSLVRGVLFDWKAQGRKGDIETEIKQLVTFLGRGLNLRRK